MNGCKAEHLREHVQIRTAIMWFSTIAVLAGSDRDIRTLNTHIETIILATDLTDKLQQTDSAAHRAANSGQI